jgi:hypothetical protein
VGKLLRDPFALPHIAIVARKAVGGARAYPAYKRLEFAGLWPKAPVIQIAGAGHYIQEDVPEVVLPARQTFLGMLR